MMSRKVHNTIEYLKQKKFFHDTFDLADEDIEYVLATYGVTQQFTEEESAILTQELHRLGEQNEFREAILSTRKSEVVGGMQMLEVEI